MRRFVMRWPKPGPDRSLVTEIGDMRLLSSFVPNGWPQSLLLFALTGMLIVLLRIPFTGVPLSHLGGIAGTTILITLGMVGIAVEVVTGRASVPWLIIPVLYLVGFYAAFLHEQRMLPRAVADLATFNANKSLPFDAARHALLVDGRAATRLTAEKMLAHFAIDRVFDHRGLLLQLGTPQACTHLRANAEFQSARITTMPVAFASTPPRTERAFCVIRMPGAPDRPVVRVTVTRLTQRFGLLPADLRELVLRDEALGTGASLRIGSARRLLPFPLPYVGWEYQPTTRQPWRFIADFVRTKPTQLQAEESSLWSDVALVGHVLGLTRSEDLASRAIGPDQFPIGSYRASTPRSHGGY